MRQETPKTSRTCRVFGALEATSRNLCNSTTCFSGAYHLGYVDVLPFSNLHYHFIATKTMLLDFVGTWRGPKCYHHTIYIYITYTYIYVYIHIYRIYFLCSFCDILCIIMPTNFTCSQHALTHRANKSCHHQDGVRQNRSRADQKHKDGRPHGPSTRWLMTLQNTA